VNTAVRWYVPVSSCDVFSEQFNTPTKHEEAANMSDYSGAAVAHDMFALLHEAAAPVVTRWSYCADDPYAVTIEIQTRGDRWVDWVLARELLVEGLSEPAGIGDVRVRPASMGEWDVTLVEICSPDGHALLEVDRDLLQQFVQATIDLVPLGSEGMVVDIDAEIEKITRSCAD
jgi:sporulation and cell division protein SsgA